MLRSSSGFVHSSDPFSVYVRQETLAQAARPEDSRHMFVCKVVLFREGMQPQVHLHFVKPEP